MCSPHEGAVYKENILVSHLDRFFLTASLSLKFAVNLCLLKLFTVKIVMTSLTAQLTRTERRIVLHLHTISYIFFGI